MEDDPERAYQFLRQALRNAPHNDDLLGALAEAAARSNLPIEHHEALGMYFLAQQRLPEALSEFETARALTQQCNQGGEMIARQRLDAQIKLVETQILAARERKKEQRH